MMRNSQSVIFVRRGLYYLISGCLDTHARTACLITGNTPFAEISFGMKRPGKVHPNSDADGVTQRYFYRTFYLVL